MEPTVPPHSRRVAELRRRRGLSQEQLEDLSGVGQATISRIEKGAWPSDRIKVRLAAALNADPYELFPLTEAIAV